MTCRVGTWVPAICLSLDTNVLPSSVPWKASVLHGNAVKGYKQALADYGVPVDANVPTDYYQESGRGHAKTPEGRREGLTAVLPPVTSWL